MTVDEQIDKQELDNLRLCLPGALEQVAQHMREKYYGSPENVVEIRRKYAEARSLIMGDPRKSALLLRDIITKFGSARLVNHYYVNHGRLIVDYFKLTIE